MQHSSDDTGGSAVYSLYQDTGSRKPRAPNICRYERPSRRQALSGSVSRLRTGVAAGKAAAPVAVAQRGRLEADAAATLETRQDLDSER